jgi:hypothetical protein
VRTIDRVPARQSLTPAPHRPGGTAETHEIGPGCSEAAAALRCRDVIAHSFKADVTPVHGDIDELASAAAEKWPAESTLRRLEAVLACRVAIEANVKPRIAVEAMMLTLWRG